MKRGAGGGIKTAPSVCPCVTGTGSDVPEYPHRCLRLRLCEMNFADVQGPLGLICRSVFGAELFGLKDRTREGVCDRSSPRVFGVFQSSVFQFGDFHSQFMWGLQQLYDSSVIIITQVGLEELLLCYFIIAQYSWENNDCSVFGHLQTVNKIIPKCTAELKV